MKIKTKLHFVVIIVLFMSFTGIAFGEEKCDFDIISLRYKDCPNILDLTVDQVTDIFGRPSYVINEFSTDKLPYTIDYQKVKDDPSYYICTKLFYPNYGLDFVFDHSMINNQKKCRKVTVYLSRFFNKEIREWYNPFPGSLTKNINANSKLRNIYDEFADYSPTKEPSEEQIKLYNKIQGMTLIMDPKMAEVTENFIYQTTIKVDTHYASFYYEPVTKFIERITIYKMNQ